MTSAELAARLHGKRSRSGWIALCPSHADRRPSLSIAVGRGGRTLLRCFAGCEIESIVHAVGLRLGDLFENSLETQPSLARAPIEMAQAALDGALATTLDREEQQLGFRAPSLTRFKNEARSEIERRFGVQLARRRAPWWEVEPHCIDPEWKALVDRASEEVAWEYDFESSQFIAKLGDLHSFHDEVLQRARRLQRELEGAT